MEKGYKNLVFFFGVIAAITFIGFYKKYFSLAPDFPGLKNIHHIHAIALTTWLSMLIIQPILIANNKMKAHRMIGKFSYLLVPIMFVSMLLVYQNQYLRMVGEGKPETETLAFLFSPTTDAIPFVIFYLLAVFYKRDTAKHMRYMISTGIVIGGPGLGRIFITWMGLDIFAAIGLITLITLMVFVGLIIYDRVKKKQFTINPYTIAFIIWLIPNILIIFFPNTTLWQSIAKWMVKTV
ncbi:MAG: hypothetical protein K1X85_13310 [Ignavibacteria bacterium]|nr:hypothetical protein [Ignavibacteria bacterium]